MSERFPPRQTARGAAIRLANLEAVGADSLPWSPRVVALLTELGAVVPLRRCPVAVFAVPDLVLTARQAAAVGELRGLGVTATPIFRSTSLANL